MIYDTIDLRSDTVTIPTEEMREAMRTTLVGDDVYADDPIVNKLEDIAAEMFGKEAALFFPSGTMSNQCALFVHAQRGDEIILPDDCHIVANEAGAAAIIAGAQIRTIRTINGEMPLDLVEETIRKNTTDVHSPKTALISYENANSCGRVPSMDYMKNIKALADTYALPIHIDGARIFNGATYLGVDVKEIAQLADSMSICLSKGLCAPIGSLLVGNKDFIYLARRKRKILGGGMRQAGVLAAPGIIALTKMSKRLQEDHDLAKYLCEKLQEIKGIEVYTERQQINMAFFKLNNFPLKGQELVNYMAKNNVRINSDNKGHMRFVTHNYLTKEHIDFVIELMKGI